MLNALAGVSLGVLTGMLLGLSASPVVGSVLGALIAGILVFLSLSNTPETAAGSTFDTTKLIRVSAFGASAIAGVLLGIMIRAEQWLGESPLRQQYTELTSIGISEADARAAILDRVRAAPLDAETERHRSPVLFAAGATVEECRELNPGNFGSAESALIAYEAAGDPWRKAAGLVRKFIIAEQQIAAVKYIHNAECEGKL